MILGTLIALNIFCAISILIQLISSYEFEMDAGWLVVYLISFGTSGALLGRAWS
jgi:hypothetical protein